MPLSFAQQRLWFLDQLDPGSVEYNVPSPVGLGGELDVAALGAALGAVVARHEVLRTRLVAGPDGVAYQVIDPPAGFPLPVADVSGEADPAAAAEGLVAADAAAPFDLAAGPLIRAVLVRLAAGDHVLGLSVHHVVFDEWSGQILRRELVVLYEAFGRGEPDPLPPLVVQYADFAVWQRRWLTEEVLAGQLAYWRGRLAGAPVLELPADRPRPPVRSTAGAFTRFAVPAEVVAGLRVVAGDHDATMFMVLFAVYVTLLGRYSGQDDVVAGTPVANRNRAETEDLIGFFVNTVVLRADLSGDPEFTGLLGRVREVALGAYAHQDLPFEQLVDALVTGRDRSRTPLFQVLFNYFTGHRQQEGQDQGSQVQGDASPGAADGRGGGAGVVLGDVQTGVLAKFDLRLVLSEDGGGLSGGVHYSTALFDAATIGRMVGHLGVLLAAVAADPGRPLSGLGVLTAGERDELARWNDTPAPVPAAGGIHELAAARAAVGPDVVAVTCGGVSLSYGGLEERANRLAHYLRGVGVGGESVVGLCLERGAGMVVAMLAVWKAGGAYLPLDPGYPAGRLAFMLADSHASVLAGTAAIVDELPAGRIRVITLDDPLTVAAVAAAPAGPPPVPAVVAGQLAYVMYTSGSTGTPKGVQVTHGGLVNYVAAVPGRAGLGEPGGAYALLQPAATDFGNTVILASLVTGGVLHVLDEAMVTDPAAVARYLAGQRIDYLKVVPSHLAALAAGGDLAGLVPARALVLGGEAVPPQLAAGLLAVAGDRRVVNHYGPTETTIGVLTATLTPALLAGGTVPVGSPAAGTRAHVLDRSLGQVPAGVTGELFLGGPQVARGYAGRPALTAERFIADPLAGDGSRLYRSGDRARWRADGQLEFLGRADDQVKIRGYRIEPGEIQTVLAAHPAITAAVVTADGDGQDRRLVAWLVPAGPAAGLPPAAELRAFVGQRLPEFMIPAVFTELAALPLTPSGKLDRAALPAPSATRPRPGPGYTAPATPTQELLAGIWAQVLGLDQAGADDSFFDLGGHSLLATQVISRIRGVFGVEIPLAALFDQPTVRGLATVIEGTAPGVMAPPVTAAARDEPLPLSFGQQRLWFLDQLDPGSAEYNIPSPVRLGGDLDVAALGAALSAVTSRHEVLRTRLVAGPDGVPHQVIGPPSPFPLPVADVSGQRDPVAAARALVTADAAAPFDLAAGPLIRAALIRLAPGEHVLALSVHHVVSDEWSAQILRRELSALYEASRAGQPDPLPPLAVQYADVAVWQRKWLAGDVLAGQLAYWRGQLAGAPVLDLPTDRPRPPIRSTTGAVARFTVPADTANELRAVAREGGATMFMVLLAAYTVLLGRYSGQDDVVAGTVSRRPQPGRNRRPDRVLRQHPGHAHRPDRRPHVHRAGRTSAGDGAGCVRAPGPAVRATSRRTGHQPRPVPHPTIPGCPSAMSSSNPGDGADPGAGCATDWNAGGEV